MSKRPATHRRKELLKQPAGVVEPIVKLQLEQAFAPHDQVLLERARTQWQFGDWDSLARINRDALQHHPARAELALLAAAGRLQIGESHSEANRFIRLAQNWGASKKLISRILIAGVHNSLGCAAAVTGQQPRALGHFENAIQVGTPGSDTRLVAQARSDLQLRQLASSKKLSIHPQNVTQATTTILEKKEQNTNVKVNDSSIVSSEIKLDTTGANRLIRGITLTERSKKRWPYFLKIEEIQVSVFLHLISEISPIRFFDIGANVGFYTLIAQKYFPELRCFAFEPTPDTFSNLADNVRSNRKEGQADVFQIALSSKRGTAEFGDFGDCSGKNAILSTSIHAEEGIKKRALVSTETLDSLYSEKQGRVIVKLDTEGHEIEVLKGGRNFFTENEVVLQVETGHKDNTSDLEALIKTYSLNLLFRLGPDSYYTNISSLLIHSTLSRIMSQANQFLISHRWDQDQDLIMKNVDHEYQTFKIGQITAASGNF